MKLTRDGYDYVSNISSQISSKINQENSLISISKKAVIIMGLTGDGKSTLLNFIAGNQLIAK